MARYKIGDKVKMTDDALDNYGEQYRDKVFTISRVATSCGWGYRQHPGYDSSVKGQGLYDFDDDSFNCSLYDWELRKA